MHNDVSNDRYHYDNAKSSCDSNLQRSTASESSGNCTDQERVSRHPKPALPVCMKCSVAAVPIRIIEGKRFEQRADQEIKRKKDDRHVVADNRDEREQYDAGPDVVAHGEDLTRIR